MIAVLPTGVHLRGSGSLCTVGEVGEKEHDFDAIWRGSSRVVWRAVYAYAGGRRDIADEAVAEAFARAIERDGEVRDPRAYVFRVAFRLAAAEMKRGSAQVELGEEGREDSHDLGDLLRALRLLSPSQRAAVYLHYEADLPVREVARLMGTSGAAVKVHLMRGRRRLAALLGEGGGGDV
jgi:RNA polymerase sigma-70 factor (ECF subfamily)